MSEMIEHVQSCRNKYVQRPPMPGFCKHHIRVNELQEQIDRAIEAANANSNEGLRRFCDEVGIRPDNTEWI